MCSQPPVNAAAVASGLFEVSLHHVEAAGDDLADVLPAGGSCRRPHPRPASRVPQIGLPTLYARRSAALGLKVVVDAVSVMP